MLTCATGLPSHRASGQANSRLRFPRGPYRYSLDPLSSHVFRNFLSICGGLT